MNDKKLEELKERYLTNNDRFWEEVWDAGVYLPVVDLFQDKTFDCVLDVGALSGEFSFWISDKSKIVYAIEPEPEEFQELVDNILFVEAKNIIPCRTAFGDVNRKGHVTIAGRGGASLSNDETPTDRDVPVRTLAHFMKMQKIKHVDILKVDIENGEEKMFESKDFEEVADTIDFIIGEHVGATSRDRLESLGFIYKDYEFGSYFFK